MQCKDAEAVFRTIYEDNQCGGAKGDLPGVKFWDAELRSANAIFSSGDSFAAVEALSPGPA